MANTSRAALRAAAAWQRAQGILREKYDTTDEVAKHLKASRQAVWKWVAVPPLKVPLVSKLTGIEPHNLRPDLPSLFPQQ